jgi:uncharacterized Tic20 family protein
VGAAHNRAAPHRPMNTTHIRTDHIPASDIRWAVAAHLSPLWVMASASMLERRPVAWAPLVAFAGPLLLALLVRERSAFVADAFRSALAFAFSIGTYSLVAGAAVAAGLAWPPAAVLLYVGLLSLLILALNWLIFAALATRAAARGRQFDYPGCLPTWRHLAARRAP